MDIQGKQDKKTGWLFPGQGSQYRGMGRGFFGLSSAVRRIFEDAEAISGQPLREISVDGDAACLRNCAVLEPLLTAFSLSYIALLRLQGLHPHCVAGYSAGETAALYCSEVISATDALKIAAARGRILQASADSAPARMTAIFDIPSDVICRMVDDLARSGTIAVAGYNAPDHLTVVGDAVLVRRLEELAGKSGATAYPLDVAGPWHSMHARDAAEQVAGYLQDIVFRPPTVPVYLSATGNAEYRPERLRQALSDQIYKPVLWQAAICNMGSQLDIRHFREVGGGRTLKGITRRISVPSNDGEFQFLNLYYKQEFEHA